MFADCCSSEAACSHVVEFAQAHVRATSNPSRPMREFARVRLCDAESGCHTVFKRYGFIPPVKIDHAELAPGLKSFPLVKLSSWVKYLLNTGRLFRQFVGVQSFRGAKLVLREYWRRFRCLRPSYGLFQLTDSGQIPLDCCIPFFSHTDEGRSYKHLGLWVLSSAGALGKGTLRHIQSRQPCTPLENSEMGLNFAGKTWTTQFLFSTMLKTTYNKHPGAQDELVRLYAEDVASMLHNGVASEDGRIRVHLVHIGTKGDLPALVRLGSFERSFSHVPKAARSRRPCDGICHLCMAGCESPQHIPFENMNPDAEWVQTLHTQPAWTTFPTILQGLQLSQEHQIEFFLTDLWHNFHLGVSKHFVGSSMVALIESNLDCIPAGSVEIKFKFLTDAYQQFWRRRGKKPYLPDINRESMGFPQGSTCPTARWSKGQASTEMMVFLDHFCKVLVKGKTDNPLLCAIVSVDKKFIHLFLFTHVWNPQCFLALFGFVSLFSSCACQTSCCKI